MKLAPPARTVEIPVCYGGEFGPDLDAVARHCRLGPGEVAARHSSADYRVQAIGFAPGFPYLEGLPQELHAPRRPTPRTSVPAGSVGIGGAQTGVYPQESPGGWQIIGRTPLVLFNPWADPPALLRAGDRVAFRPISPEEFRRRAAEAEAFRPSGSSVPRPAGRPWLEVVKPGLLTTVQDLGRPGWRAAGVSPGGAMDAFALRAANLLVGNPEGAAALEITLAAPELVFSDDTWVAVGGAEFEGAPSWKPRLAPAGRRLALGACRRGCRGYIAVAGGIAVEPVLDSRGTDLRAGFGGWGGRALRAGDRLPIGASLPPPADFAHFLSPSLLPAYTAAPVLRAVAGAHAAEFGSAFWGSEFTVTPQSDRMGLRLSGPKLERTSADEPASSAVAPGTVQVPPDGRPIILAAEAQTIGGYPQAAHVAAVDLPLVAQLRPGDAVRFREITPEEADRLERAREHALAIAGAELARRFRRP